jgi:hypothetical protein
MTMNSKLADIIRAIEIWKNDCEERGEEPVSVASFVSTGPNWIDRNARCVAVGEPKEVARLLTYTTESLAPVLRA